MNNLRRKLGTMILPKEPIPNEHNNIVVSEPLVEEKKPQFILAPRRVTRLELARRHYLETKYGGPDALNR